MSAVTASDLERRRTAIESSGWGARFDFVQPHNACFWVYLAGVISGGWYVVNAVASSGGAFDVAYATAVVTSGLFCAAFLAFLHHADRWERTPASLALAAFLGGGLAATFAIAIVGNAALSSLYTKAFGQAWAVDWQAGLTAPFVEETSKGAIFVLLLGLAPVVIRTAADGLIVGAYVGLGFQILEDILYAQNSAYAAFGAHQADAVLSLFVLRAITGIPSHALYTALFGAGVIYALGTTAQPRRLGRGILLMLSAVVIHGVWDSASAIGGPFYVVLVLLGVTVGSVLMLLVAIRWAGWRERQYLHDIMAPEATAGTITEAELNALPDRKASRGGRREKHVLRAARDLAADLAEAGGEDTPDVLHARAEVARLRGR
jgi:RsiW-degrading membrane proteinase PrsW (M82 family)